MKQILPEGEERLLKKRNRAKKLSQKKHKIYHLAGQKTKTFYIERIQKILTKSKA